MLYPGQNLFPMNNAQPITLNLKMKEKYLTDSWYSNRFQLCKLNKLKYIGCFISTAWSVKFSQPDFMHMGLTGRTFLAHRPLGSVRNSTSISASKTCMCMTVSLERSYYREESLKVSKHVLFEERDPQTSLRSQNNIHFLSIRLKHQSYESCL